MSRVLVTGAASGLGLELVRRFAGRGDDVLATDAADTPALPDEVHFRKLDVRSDEDWEAARDWVERTWDGLDVLVNNAGLAAGGRIDKTPMADWELVTAVNLLGAARGCRTFAPMLKAQRSGHIVNVASIAGLVHPPGMACYNATKAGVVALSETLYHELAPYGVSTSVVCPSFFRSNLASSLRGGDPDVVERAAALIENSELSAEDVAGVVLEGIDAEDPVILTDDIGRASYLLKHSDRGAYDDQMQLNARRAFEREQAGR
ncbi:MAG TPA: SDR family NAD(P)-dependent oxidoreductase [Nocardioidaceae bacterium]|nr:SDR family NAD(P)-dependent oxidoreductase [Nocardioidaceae bacterium]